MRDQQRDIAVIMGEAAMFRERHPCKSARVCQISRYDQCIPCGLNRSTVPRRRRLIGKTSDDRECRSTEPSESRPEEWLLIEWPEGEEAPTKYWLSTLPTRREDAPCESARLRQCDGLPESPLGRARIARLVAAKASNAATKTIADFERGAREPYPRTLDEIQAALERRRVHPRERRGAGVRLAKRGKRAK
jgi:hypothetical protein